MKRNKFALPIGHIPELNEAVLRWESVLSDKKNLPQIPKCHLQFTKKSILLPTVDTWAPREQISYSSDVDLKSHVAKGKKIQYY